MHIKHAPQTCTSSQVKDKEKCQRKKYKRLAEYEWVTMRNKKQVKKKKRQQISSAQRKQQGNKTRQNKKSTHCSYRFGSSCTHCHHHPRPLPSAVCLTGNRYKKSRSRMLPPSATTPKMIKRKKKDTYSPWLRFLERFRTSSCFPIFLANFGSSLKIKGIITCSLFLRRRNRQAESSTDTAEPPAAPGRRRQTA